MQHQTLTPVAFQERIQTIDIIRGIALLGIVIINFTVDDFDGGVYDKFNGWADQSVYWTIRVLLDDRFQTIYCFLFGLGFALQMQRAAERNKSFVFIYLRRMIALYILSTVVYFLVGEGYNVLPYYAMVGVLLLLFWKVPTKFLPVLAAFFFLLPLIRNTIVRRQKELKTQALTKSSTSVDSSILNRYVGVFVIQSGPPPNNRMIFRMLHDSLIGEGPARQFYLTPLSDTQFLRRDLNQVLTFKKDSSGATNIVEMHLPDGRIILARRININFLQALNEQLRPRETDVNSDRYFSYAEFVKRNVTHYWSDQKNVAWKDFISQYLWRGNYKIGYILVLFLLGLYAGKRRIFFDVGGNRHFLEQVLKRGLLLGGLGVISFLCFQAWNYYAYHGWGKYSVFERLTFDVAWSLGIIFMAIAYVAGLTLLVQNRTWEKRLSFFSTLGRMGLTNYILHLFAALIIFGKVSWFFGLEGKVGNLVRLLLALPVYFVLYLFSRWWLARFRQGPFEWLWRSLSYLQVQPMRLKPPAS